MASSRVAAILAGLVQAGQAAVPASELPGRLVTECASALPVSGAGLIWMTDRGPGSMLAASNANAGALEDLQFTLGEGPCVDASQSGRTVSVPDLTTDGVRRWPGFTTGALETGVSAVFAVPLQVGGIRVGVLDMHRDEVGGLGSAGLLEAFAFAEAATEVLLHLQAMRNSVAEMDLLLNGSSGGRAVVHQATGMVSVQLSVSLSEALARLRARSFAQERPITELARDVVERRVRFGE
jgi:hypothetical protein